MPGTHRNRHGGRLFTLCINKMETLFFAAGADDHGNPWLEGHLNVSRAALAAEAGSLTRQRARHPNLELATPGYESGGGDVIGVRFFDVDGLVETFQMPGAIKAARTLNLMLMRKGPTFQWRWHNYELADWAFRSEPDRDALIAVATAEMRRAAEVRRG